MAGKTLWNTGNEFEAHADTVLDCEVEQGLVVSKKPDGIPEGRQAMRYTIGMVLMDLDVNHPRFAFHRQRKIPKKPEEYYRLDNAGGGIATKQQRATEKQLAEDPLIVDPRLVQDGKVPPNFDFLYLGKGLLETGAFPKLEPDVTPENLEEALRAGLRTRIGDELGERAMGFIEKPQLLNTAQPRDSHLTSAGFGPFTADLAKMPGFGVDEKREKLTGIILTIREFFALALCDIDRLQKAAGDRIEIHTPESLEELVQKNVYGGNEMPDLSTWKERPAGSLRNSSLLAGVAASLKQVDTSWKGNFLRSIIRLKRMLGSGGFVA